MKHKITVAFVIISIFAIFGFMMMGNLLHELNHQIDFKEIAKDGEICILKYDNSNFWERSIADYKFTITPEDNSEYEQISKYTEVKSLAIYPLLLGFIFIFSYWSLINERGKND